MDRQLVRLTVWWQPYDRNWYLSLAYQTGAGIISGRRLITGQNVMAGVVSEFHGSIVVYGLDDEIGLGAWEVSHELLYDSER